MSYAVCLSVFFYVLIFAIYFYFVSCDEVVVCRPTIFYYFVLCSYNECRPFNSVEFKMRMFGFAFVVLEIIIDCFCYGIKWKM